MSEIITDSMGLLRKDQLTPGGQVRNRISGFVGTVREDPQNPGRLVPRRDGIVAILLKAQPGRAATKTRHENWKLSNLVRLPSETTPSTP